MAHWASTGMGVNAGRTGKMRFPCPRSAPESREKGLAVPSRVSLLILQRLNLVFTQGIPFPPTASRDGVHVELYRQFIAYRWRSLLRVRRVGAGSPFRKVMGALEVVCAAFGLTVRPKTEIMFLRTKGMPPP